MARPPPDRFTVIGSFALLGLLIFGMVKIGPIGPRDPCTERPALWAAAQDAVRATLTAPSTAQFLSIDSPQVLIAQISPCRYDVIGQVDAQNGFGAMVRAVFVMEMTYSRTAERWIASNLSID